MVGWEKICDLPLEMLLDFLFSDVLWQIPNPEMPGLSHHSGSDGKRRRKREEEEEEEGGEGRRNERRGRNEEGDRNDFDPTSSIIKTVEEGTHWQRENNFRDRTTTIRIIDTRQQQLHHSSDSLFFSSTRPTRGKRERGQGKEK